MTKNSNAFAHLIGSGKDPAAKLKAPAASAPQATKRVSAPAPTKKAGRFEHLASAAIDPYANVIEPDAATTASDILAAGRKARSATIGTPINTSTATGQAAAQIIAAGKKRRGEA